MKQWPRHTSFPRAGTCPTIRSGNSQPGYRDPRCQNTSAARAVPASADVSHVQPASRSGVRASAKRSLAGRAKPGGEPNRRGIDNIAYVSRRHAGKRDQQSVQPQRPQRCTWRACRVQRRKPGYSSVPTRLTPFPRVRRCFVERANCRARAGSSGEPEGPRAVIRAFSTRRY